MKKTNQKGITLVALIITIIVMLILVGVSVNIVLGNGLFKVAQKGARDTDAERQKEESLSAGTNITIGNTTYSSIESYISGNAGIPEGAKVGDTVEYKPTTYTRVASKEIILASDSYPVDGNLSGTGSSQSFEEDTDLEWQILSMDEVTGKIELIADRATNTQLTLKGTAGWNNLSTILNNICGALYSNKDYGTARSINKEDAEKLPEDLRNVGKKYWLETKYSYGGNNWDTFYVDIVDADGTIKGSVLRHVSRTWNSNGTTSTCNDPVSDKCSLRPLVTLNDGVCLTYDTTGTCTWKLEKKAD